MTNQLLEIMKAEHVGVRELKESMSRSVRMRKPRIVTVNGKPAQFMIPYQDMVELLEMFEEFKNDRIRTEVRNGRAAYRETGRGVSAKRLWEKFGA